MSAKPVQQKAPWVLAVLLLLQVVLMSAMARRPDHEQSMLRVWLTTPVSFVVGNVTKAGRWVKDGVAGYVDLRHARDENSSLKERNDQLAEQLNAAREKVAELEQIRTERALPVLAQYRQIAANVIFRDTSLWFHQLAIDRGSLDGIKRDMPIVAGGGIVGRVINVGPNYSLVQLITDKHAGVGAMLQGSRAMGEIKGEVRGNDSNLCELRNISSSEEVQPGEAIVTTGLDRIY